MFTSILGYWPPIRIRNPRVTDPVPDLAKKTSYHCGFRACSGSATLVSSVFVFPLRIRVTWFKKKHFPNFQVLRYRYVFLQEKTRFFTKWQKKCACSDFGLLVLNFYLQLSLLVGIDVGCSPLSLVMQVSVLWSGPGTVLRYMFSGEEMFYFWFLFCG
jgi:hypothetical protein